MVAVTGKRFFYEVTLIFKGLLITDFFPTMLAEVGYLYFQINVHQWPQCGVLCSHVLPPFQPSVFHRKQVEFKTFVLCYARDENKIKIQTYLFMLGIFNL